LFQNSGRSYSGFALAEINVYFEAQLRDMSELPPTKVIPTPEPKVLKDRYELRELLGKGGMGSVYRGFDRVLHRKVAIKLISNVTAPSVIERFEREAQILSQINNPHLAAVFDFGVAEDVPFMVMELIEGKSLGKLLEERQKLEPAKALPIISQIADGLNSAHNQGIVHRDIKPDNILICENDGKTWIEIVDFGLAISREQIRDQRLTSPGFTVGTQRYMAPEQMEGKLPTAATDIYSFGLVCAEMLLGEDCLLAGRLKSSTVTKCSDLPFLPILTKACEEEPSDRWNSVSEMVVAFEEVWRDLPQASSTSYGIAARSSFQKARKKRRWIASITFVSVLLSLILAAFTWLHVSSNKLPVVAIDRVTTNWVAKDEVEIEVDGLVSKAEPRRMMVEAVVCNAEGKRVLFQGSNLDDGALGSLQVLDITQTPQRFQKSFRIKIPASVESGYASITIFDHDRLLIAQGNSALWKR
jgi:serine/threonine protein kinase